MSEEVEAIAFPWPGALRLPRSALVQCRTLSDRLGRAFLEGTLGTALAAYLGGDAAVSWGLFRPTDGPRRAADGPSFVVLLPGVGLRVEVRAEADLVRRCVAGLLDEQFELGWGDAELDVALRGAGAALALDIARRCSRAEAPRLDLTSAAPMGWRLERDATVITGQRPYRLRIEVSGLPPTEPELPGRPVSIARLGWLRISLPWVCALAPLAAADAAALRPGDVWVPGGGWVRGAPGEESPERWPGWLAAPRAEYGWPVRARADGAVQLGHRAEVLPGLEVEAVESAMEEKEPELGQVLGQAPVVVRLEVGALEMTAAEWAALRPGDLVDTGRRVSEGVLLRVGGQVIARGELVEIEGDMGVRITKVAATSSAPPGGEED